MIEAETSAEDGVTARGMSQAMRMNRTVVALALVVGGCGSASLPAETAGQPAPPAGAPTSSNDVADAAPGAPEDTTGAAPVAPPDPRSAQIPEHRLRRSILSETDDANRDFGGRVDTIASSGGGMIGPRMRVRAGPLPGHPGLYEMTLNNTGSGWEEKFLLLVPNVAPPAVAPLLVAFHKFGNSQWDIEAHTTFIQECRGRGWYCVAPLGATQVSFGSIESQINTRAALDFVVNSFNVDRTRVYAVGFSMGAGAAVNYAARHLDPAGVMFAAVANHTGGVSLAHTWANEFDDADVNDNWANWQFLEAPDYLEFWFGGPPAAQAFNYQRSSAIDLDPVGGTIGVDTDLARNLAHVPILDWIAAGDPIAYLQDQMAAFHNHVGAQNPGNQLVTAPGSNHTWNTLNETDVCDYLAQFSLQLPASGSTLADEDGVYFRFNVEQDAPGAFTPFTWTLVPGMYVFDLTATTNLKRIVIESAAAGLKFLRPWTVNLSTADGTGDRVVFRDVPHPPTSVTRDGVPAFASYDGGTNSLEIVETDPAPHTWVLAFP